MCVPVNIRQTGDTGWKLGQRHTQLTRDTAVIWRWQLVGVVLMVHSLEEVSSKAQTTPTSITR